MELVEAAVEEPLDLIVVEFHSLYLSALVFVVEGHRLSGRVDGEASLRFVVFAGDLPHVEGLRRRIGQKSEHQDHGVGVRHAVRVDVCGGLSEEGVLVESISRETVEGTRLHGDSSEVTVGLLRQVKGLQHTEAWRREAVQENERTGGSGRLADEGD